jgi:protein-tyrosine phosphatase
MTDKKTHRVIFVCSGNICRSPMAAVIAAQKMTSAGISHRIISAGTLGLMNRRAAEHAVTAVSEIGLDLSDHRSQSANSGILNMADVIVVMSPMHTTHIKKLNSALTGKILELWRFAPREYGILSEIADPVGKNLETFRRSRDLIAGCIDIWLGKLGY